MSITGFGLSADGYLAPREADFLEAIRDRYTAELVALGITEEPDYDRDVLVGNLSEIMAFMLWQLSEAGQAVYDARSPSNATGLQLGNLALIVGVPRNPATFSTTILTCTGGDGTPITQGKIAEGGGDNDDQRWVITQDATIGDVTTGTVDVTARAEDKGQIVATIGQIDKIVTTVTGWTGVTNAAAADPGNDRETDSELRVRRQAALQAAGSTSTNAILSGLLNLDDVTSAVVVDNKTGTAVVTDGIAIDPYAVASVVAPNSLSAAQQQLVIEAIYNNLGAGTATSGDQSGTVTKRDGRSETINFYFGADSDVDLVWVLEMDPGFVVTDVEDTLDDSVVDYFATLFLGGTVYPMDLICLAANIDGIANVTSLTLNGGTVPVTHDANEQPVLGTNTIT